MSAIDKRLVAISSGKGEIGDLSVSFEKTKISSLLPGGEEKKDMFLSQRPRILYNPKKRKGDEPLSCILCIQSAEEGKGEIYICFPTPQRERLRKNLFRPTKASVVCTFVREEEKKEGNQREEYFGGATTGPFGPSICKRKKKRQRAGDPVG